MAKRKAGAVRKKKKTSARVGSKASKRRKVEEAPPPPADVGRVGWLDITVPDASKLRDFYKRVVGWASAGVEMGGYEDYMMAPPNGEAVAGVCHSRGANVGM